MPNLKLPALDISKLCFSDREQVQRGMPAAIARWLNQVLQPMQMTAKCGRKGDRLGVVVEAETVPDQSLFRDWMRHQFNQLHLEEVCTIEVYGRQLGKTCPAWRETIEVERIQVLRFHISPTVTALLPLECVREVLSIAAKEILPIPQMPSCVLGVHYYRGTILWLVDLGLQLGLNGLDSPNFAKVIAQRHVPSSSASSLSIVVIAAEQKTLGLVVSTVLDVESHSWQEFQPATVDSLLPVPLPFVKSYLQHSQISLLQATNIINDRCLQRYENAHLTG